MKPLHALGADEATRLSGLLFDLDDTFLDHGRLTLHAFESLFRLRKAGLRLGVLTGRPAGFGQVLCMQWPVDFVVTENGGVTFLDDGGRLRRLDRYRTGERREQRERLALLALDLERRFGLAPTQDNVLRISDYTLDIGELARPDPESVRAAEELAREHVYTARSSIHLHLSETGEDKASAAVRVLRERFGEDASQCLHRYAFIGDSENDSACFAAFHTTIGVANLSGRPSIGPRYRTTRARSEGFAEAAAHLLRLRQSASLAPAAGEQERPGDQAAPLRQR